MSASQGDPVRPFDTRSASMVATEHVLFGRLNTEDPASAVARRVRTAIGLGVLVDGQKLPKEADLARQLGVTAFSLREALGILRDEGLIVTRVGKNGGSFVQVSPASNSLAGDELARLTATELRDLGDWRAGLTTYAAWLAAQRVSDAGVERLGGYVDQLASSDSPAHARRALGRFHVELAAGAQSMRLARAELSMHEEFDWLVQVLLLDTAHRSAIVLMMRDVCAAVRARDPHAAWQAGERLVSYEVRELMRARLQQIASVSTDASPGKRRRTKNLAPELRRICQHTTKLLAEISRQVVDDIELPSNAGALSGAIARSVWPRLGQVEQLIHGVGFMAEVGALPDARYWMQWWQRAADGTFDRDYSHQLDPARDDFYEYGSKDYLTRPRDTGRATAMGPYIDHGGVDDYLITISVPVAKGRQFFGVMCADVKVAGLERALAPWLAQERGLCVVLNDEKRVLLSNSIRYSVGAVLPGDSDLSRTDVGCFGWTIAHAHPGR